MSEEGGSKTQDDMSRMADKLTDQAIMAGGKAIAKVAMQLLEAAVAALFACAACATDPFYRNYMGERYFTPIRALLGFFGWLFMLVITVPVYRSFVSLVAPAWAVQFLLPCRWIALSFSLLILVVYCVRSYNHRQEIERRQTSGEIWHSRSKGESIFGTEDLRRDLLVDLVVFVLLLPFTPLSAFFYAFSRCLGYAADAMAWAILYNRYLDIQDARIEAQFMEGVLRDGLPPRRMGGLFGPMPERFKGEHRGNIARVVAAGVYGAATGPMPSVAEVGATVGQPPKSAPTLDIIETGRKILAAVLGSKLFRVLVILVIAVSVLGYGSVLGYRAVRALWHHSMARPVVQVQPSQPAISSPSPPPLVATEVQNQTPASQVPVAQVTATPTADEIAAQELARVEKLKQMEAQRVQEQEEQRIKARNQIVEQIKTTLDRELAQVGTFKSNCLATLDDNTNQIAKLSYSYRKELTKLNDAERQADLAELEKQEAVLIHDQQSLQDLLAQPGADAQRIYNVLLTSLGRMQDNRQTITANLNDLNSEIAKAPKKTSLFHIILR